MADPDFNLQSLHSNFQKVYKAVLSRSGSSSNDSAQKQAVAFGQQVKQAEKSESGLSLCTTIVVLVISKEIHTMKDLTPAFLTPAFPSFF